MQLHSTRSSASIPTVTSHDPVPSFDDEAEDFNDDWGGFADDDGFGNTAAAKEEEDPWGTPAVSKTAATTSFDDQGEPDFAGWLAAQSQSKKTLKSPLPKGLTKSNTPAAKSTRPIVGGRSSTTGSTARKVVVPAKKEVKKPEPKPKVDDEEVEGWGDEW
jgi:SCY1-like protein 1